MTKTYTDAPCPILNQKGRNIGHIWSFYGRLECPTIVNFGTDTDELAYFRVISAATSGDLEGVRARVESEAETGTTMNINAFHGDAVVNASGYAATVRGIYTDAMVKASGTCTSVRGGDFNTSIYAGASITNVEGLRVVVGHPSSAVSISGVDTLLHLVLDGSNNHVADSAIDIDCDHGTTVTTGIDFGTDNVVTAIDVGGCSVFFDADVTLAAADNAAEIIVTDSATISTGITRSLYIEHTISGVKTSSADVEPLSVVLQTSGSGSVTDQIYIAHFHWDNHIGNITLGSLVGLQIDMDDMGNACGNFIGLDVYRDGTNNASTRSCSIRCANGGSGTLDEAILIDGKFSAVFELTIQGNTAIPSATVGTQTYRIPVNVVDIAGQTGTLYYIPLFSAS